MPASSTEQTISQVIGAIIIIPEYAGLEAALRNTIPELEADYQLLTDANEESIKGPFIKYGILDVTFQHNETQQFLKIFCQADDRGWFNHLKKTGIKHDFDEFLAYVLGYLKHIEPLFPAKVNIIDCCMTNDQWVWSEKYEYS
ncbi:hypothetical protein Q5H92_10645 [Hymenobacter sp. M29]|uniref:Uncharacterized protein n=1 Tax=Hymenobacter mellowenesis TaxID=3063995 RepID=A0ABT9ACV0_9BACT|nr:hypothetical protein [Hymenobacter sp. M29]MDO7846816.1 hypothetical protein [Hymenobacter sp. M29]